MKTKRFVSTLLALLLVCSLPVSAFAMDNNPAGTTVTEIPTGETMDINDGTVENNNGTVSTNNGTVTDNYKTVNNNYGTVTTNNGTVTNNGTQDDHANAIVENNNGTVNSNYGVVTDNKKEIEINYNGAEVTDNKAGAVVHTNRGTVKTNNGTVRWNDRGSIVETNNGTAQHNGGTVETNNGTVNANQRNAEVTNNKEGAVVYSNYGTVSINEGTVTQNYGTVTTNEITGTVTNKDNGAVGTNYGTVKRGNTTWYGVLVDNDGTTALEQKESGQAVDFSQLTKEGYVYAGYTQAYGMENGKVTLLPSPITVNSTSYTVTCPNVLTLIWQAIVSPGSGENTAAAGETAAAADDGAGYFGPGSHIAINGRQYLLVAVVEDVYCLASVDSFEDEELSDLPALLASLLTEEQLTHVTGEPELLDEALTARFFGGQGSHIVFPCDSSLIFS